MQSTRSVDVAVIGGGLAGLAAAAYAARGGRCVALFEKARALGGRAMTTRSGEFHFNLGPHALFHGGPAEAALHELGVPLAGGGPAASGAYAVARGTTHALPGGFLSLLTTGLFGPLAKLETARQLGALRRLDPEPLQRVSLADWLHSAIRGPDVRALVGALARLCTYSANQDRMSAAPALAQVQAVLGKGVRYLDHGWQTLVDGLRDVAAAAGAQLHAGARVDAVRPHGPRWEVATDGGRCDATAVVLATGPAEAAAVLEGAAGAVLRRWSEEAFPAYAACLDVGLSRLPRPRATFALGIDRPLYLSVHSTSARLAPDGGATVLAAKYLTDRNGDARQHERELEGLLDLVQPGWRAEVVERRYLPNMMVMNTIPVAASGGTHGRPTVEVPGARGLYVAGDWVGPVGMLADAAFASARRAAELIARDRECLAAAS
ncbi:MAG: FAD-dependent oxidoreductase [Candidatus Binatia bacterium]